MHNIFMSSGYNLQRKKIKYLTIYSLIIKVFKYDKEYF